MRLRPSSGGFDCRFLKLRFLRRRGCFLGGSLRQLRAVRPLFGLREVFAACLRRGRSALSSPLRLPRGGVPDCQAEGGKFRLYTQKNRASGNPLASLPKSQGSRWQAGGGSGAAAENSGGAVFCRLKPVLRRASLLEVSAPSASKFRRFSRGSLPAAFSLPL